MTADSITERGIISELGRIFRSPPPPRGMGDDCALIRHCPDGLLISTDMLSESTHFSSHMNGYQKGRMAVSVNLSDIAAMGGKPVAMVVSLGFPHGTGIGEIRRVASGMASCARAYGLQIIGGDTKLAKELTIAVTVMGKTTGRPLLRSSAKPGELVAITGRVGEAAADFINIKKGKRPRKNCRLFNPVPRLEEGQALSTSRAASAAIDMTDGLALSAWYISRASGVRLVIDSDAVPVSPLLMKLDLNGHEWEDAVFHWGGDYELLFTARSRKVLERTASEYGLHVTVIGMVEKGSGVVLKTGSSVRMLDERGYDAFGAGRTFTSGRH